MLPFSVFKRGRFCENWDRFLLGLKKVTLLVYGVSIWPHHDFFEVSRRNVSNMGHTWHISSWATYLVKVLASEDQKMPKNNFLVTILDSSIELPATIRFIDQQQTLNHSVVKTWDEMELGIHVTSNESVWFVA